MKKKTIPSHLFIYTDGSCLCNPGPGGWAFAVYENNWVNGDGEKPKTNTSWFEDSGGESDSTNNRMEITAALMALDFICVAAGYRPKNNQNGNHESKRSVIEATIFTDSQYVQKGASEWLAGWKKRGWIGSNKKPVANQDLWAQMDEAIERLNGQVEIQWVWVKAHHDNELNNHVDEMARRAAKTYLRPALKSSSHPQSGLDHQNNLDHQNKNTQNQNHPKEADGAQKPPSQNKKKDHPDRVYLNVPFAEKDQAKTLGAKWDGERKKWFVTKKQMSKGQANQKLARWR